MFPYRWSCQPLCLFFVFVLYNIIAIRATLRRLWLIDSPYTSACYCSNIQNNAFRHILLVLYSQITRISNMWSALCCDSHTSHVGLQHIGSRDVWSGKWAISKVPFGIVDSVVIPASLPTTDFLTSMWDNSIRVYYISHLSTSSSSFDFHFAL